MTSEPTPPQGQAGMAQVLAMLPPNVELVKTFASPTGRDLRVLMVIEGYDHLRSRVYVQWLGAVNESGNRETLDTREITHALLRLSDPTATPSPQGWSIAFDAQSSYDWEVRSKLVVIVPERPGPIKTVQAPPGPPLDGGGSAAPDDATDFEIGTWGLSLWYPTLAKKFTSRPAARCDGPGCLRITPQMRYLEGEGGDDPREGAVVIEPKVDSPRSFERPFPDAEGNPFWLDSLAYRVNYNAHGILDITYVQSGTGAYSWSSLENRTYDTKSGRVLRGSDVFREERRQMLEEALANRVRDAIERQRNVEPESREYLTDELADSAAAGDSTSWDRFVVTPDGVILFVNFGLPNVVKAFTPRSEYAFSWSEIEPYLREDGPLWAISRSGKSK